MWLYNSPKNYIEMIEKISKSVFVITLVLLFLFSSAFQAFSDFLKMISLGVEYNFQGIKLNISLIYIPLLIGFLEHAFKIHDKISYLLGIRKFFDRNVIIKEFFDKLNIQLDIKYLDNSITKRLMTFIFYEYASSTKPKIDTHYIHLALGCWCWFWIWLDTLLVTLIMGIIFLFWNWSLNYFLIFILAIVIIVVLMVLLFIQAKTYAKNEVRMILAKYRKRIVESISNALQD